LKATSTSRASVLPCGPRPSVLQGPWSSPLCGLTPSGPQPCASPQPTSPASRETRSRRRSALPS